MTNLTDAIFNDEDAAREHLESIRWANGIFCPHCGSTENIRLMQGKSHRKGVYQCNACTDPFTVTVGTVMERSHIPLAKWVLGFHLMAASKKGISASQLGRMLGVTYKTAWFMSHRIRESMTVIAPEPLGGEGKIVEADEAYHGRVKVPIPSKTRRGRPFTRKDPTKQKRAIVALVERGGEARAEHVPHVTSLNVREVLMRHADAQSRLQTDESNFYRSVGDEFASHETISHRDREYARGDVTTNTVEGFFGVFKRGMVGIYQHCGEQHFQRYLDEFTFRYNTREKLGFTDDMRASRAIKGADGKRLTYRRISNKGKES